MHVELFKRGGWSLIDGKGENEGMMFLYWRRVVLVSIRPRSLTAQLHSLASFEALLSVIFSETHPITYAIMTRESVFAFQIKYAGFHSPQTSCWIHPSNVGLLVASAIGMGALEHHPTDENTMLYLFHVDATCM